MVVCVCVLFARGMPVGRESCGGKLGRGCCLASPDPNVLGGAVVEGAFVVGKCFFHFALFGVDSHSRSVFVLVIILHMKI